MKIKNESGRTMVEILGVVGVIIMIGVVSIHFINSLVAQHRAYQVADAVTKGVALIDGGQISTENALRTHFGRMISGSYGALYVFISDGEIVRFTLTGVSETCVRMLIADYGIASDVTCTRAMCVNNQPEGSTTLQVRLKGN